ncbi:MAG: ComF family protein [Desulfovibrio sp.]|jgi:ComF family protein|nr:ComF family protein [Desulfovibrio sp.]
MFLNSLRRLWKNLGLAQTRCTYCLAPFTPETGANTMAPLCPACAGLFAPSGAPRCLRCALPLDTETTLCGECLSNPPPWEGIAAYGLYQGELRNALLRLKFDGEIAIASLLGACLFKIASALPLPDALVAVPQHPVHLRRRGFNQAHEIAKALHRRAGIPLRADLLRRTAAHIPQTGLSAAARRRNTRQMFEAAPQVRDLALWLVDDVMTTGVTLRAAARALRGGGAREILVLIVARTPLDSLREPY